MDRALEELLDSLDGTISYGFRQGKPVSGGMAARSRTDFTAYCRRNKDAVRRRLQAAAGGRYTVRVTDGPSKPNKEYAVYLEITRPGKEAWKYGMKLFTTPDGYCSINIMPLGKNFFGPDGIGG